MTIALIDTGCANIASVRFALDRARLDHVVVTEPAGAVDCDRIILPGVGAAGPAMERLKARGWSEALPGDGRPLMGICCLLYTSPSPRDLSTSRMPSSA